MEKVIEALDALALALDDHRHQWTDQQGQLYVRAVAILKREPSKPRQTSRK